MNGIISDHDNFNVFIFSNDSTPSPNLSLWNRSFITPPPSPITINKTFKSSGGDYSTWNDMVNDLSTALTLTNITVNFERGLSVTSDLTPIFVGNANGQKLILQTDPNVKGNPAKIIGVIRAGSIDNDTGRVDVRA
jgi:hypothetical protein